MKIKSLYLNRITTLKTELKNTESYVSKRHTIINEYVDIIQEVLSELKTISNDENIEPHIKYIQLNEKTTDIEKITAKIEELYNDINKKVVHVNKEKALLIQNCIEDHPNLSEDAIVTELNKLLFEVQ
ncbi:MAG: hypothetical protein RLZZ546_769 [Bacteroidota bacterium]|jgi:hypothetical protein